MVAVTEVTTFARRTSRSIGPFLCLAILAASTAIAADDKNGRRDSSCPPPECKTIVAGKSCGWRSKRLTNRTTLIERRNRDKIEIVKLVTHRKTVQNHLVMFKSVNGKLQCSYRMGVVNVILPADPPIVVYSRKVSDQTQNKIDSRCKTLTKEQRRHLDACR